jgi:hypothetical protein
MAPATINSCGPLLAIMPGIALARNFRILPSKAIRIGVATLSPRRISRINNCSNPAAPMVAASTSALRPASCRHVSSPIVTAISATLNNSGENADSATRPCAFISAISTVTGPAKARYGSISRASPTASCSVSVPTKPGASAVTTSGINRPTSAVVAISAALMVPSNRPAKAAAAAAPSVSRVRSQAGTSAAFSAPSVNNRRTTLTS